MCARRFLFLVAILILLAVAAAFALFQFGDRALTSIATPKGHFQAPPPKSGPDYARLENWIARPDLPQPENPSLWRPDGWPPPILRAKSAATFYVHPTTYLERDRWNAALDDVRSRDRAILFVRSQASAFNDDSDIWAPRYRQAAFGAFLLRSEDATRALDLAYSDVLAAFDAFLAAQPAGKPLILAGHSQGSLHLSRLLVDRRAALKGRLVAAYIVGWPISTTADLPATGLTACAGPDQAGCVLSWQSFSEPANVSLVLDAWKGSKGPTGIERRREDMVCTNPLTGGAGAAAPAGANLGTLVPDTAMGQAELTPGLVGARCEDGFLLIGGAIPALGPYVLPGNNHHVYDYALFWGSIRADAERRLKAFRA